MQTKFKLCTLHSKYLTKLFTSIIRVLTPLYFSDILVAYYRNSDPNNHLNLNHNFSVISKASPPPVFHDFR